MQRAQFRGSAVSRDGGCDRARPSQASTATIGSPDAEYETS
jgi:hypothetical protein